ncbi:flavodoxin [Ruminococcaceae bacterium OttesenSCG-928-N02]|nr:flavodoxin [Ruminococcaceae bacterium OttesenSCG-928-N02]
MGNDLLMNTTLIAYFSYTGAARNMMTTVAMLTTGTPYLIDPVAPYPQDYKQAVRRAQAELTQKARPELKGAPANLLDGFKKVVLIYPNWCGTLPPPVSTFLESYDFTGKEILPICLHGGGGPGFGLKVIQKTCPTAKVGTLLALEGRKIADEFVEIQKWTRQMVY